MAEVAVEPGPWVGICPRGVDRKWKGPRVLYLCDYSSPHQHWEGTGKVGDETCLDVDYQQMKANFGEWGNGEGKTPYPFFTRCPILNNVTSYLNREVIVGENRRSLVE